MSGSKHIPYLVMDQVKDDPIATVACVKAINDIAHGETAVGRGDKESAITEFLKAHSTLQGIPKARALLGIIKNKLAACYAGLGEHERSSEYSRDALAIAAGDPTMAYEEAFARMSLGFSLWVLGDSRTGRNECLKARALFSLLPGCEQNLAELDENVRMLVSRLGNRLGSERSK